MAGIHSRYSQLLVDEFDFSGETSGFSVECAGTVQECTTLADAAKTYQATLHAGKITQRGYFNTPAAGNLGAELNARLAASGAVVTGVLASSVAACPVYSLPDTFGEKMSIQAPLDNLLTLDGEWSPGASGMKRAIRVFSGTLDATGDETAYDLGAAGSAGGLVIAHVTGITGSATDAQIKVQSSATEGGTYADEATIEFDDVGGYTAAMSGTVNRWLRLRCEDLGGADDFTVHVFAVVYGVTQTGG